MTGGSSRPTASTSRRPIGNWRSRRNRSLVARPPGPHDGPGTVSARAGRARHARRGSTAPARARGPRSDRACRDHPAEPVLEHRRTRRELVHAVAEAIDVIDGYSPPDRPCEPSTPGPGTAAWATEAPRGLLFHHYELDDRGRIASAMIVRRPARTRRRSRPISRLSPRRSSTNRMTSRRIGWSS